MSVELTYLLYAVILLLVHILVQATLSDLSKGIGWALGPQPTTSARSRFAS